MPTQFNYDADAVSVSLHKEDRKLILALLEMHDSFTKPEDRIRGHILTLQFKSTLY